MKKLAISIFSLLFLLNLSFAQNETKKFAIGVNGGVTDFFGFKVNDPKTFYKKENVNFYKGPFNLMFSYNVVKPLNVVLSASTGTIEEFPDPLKGNNFWKVDLGVQFRFLSLFADDELWFDPYLYGVGGIAEINRSGGLFGFNGGLGINFWINEFIGLSVQSGLARTMYEDDKYFHYETLFGIKVRFGKAPDTDGDGIPDHKDACPNAPGLEQFNGCPDADGDGIPDKDDNCPQAAGDAKFNGCPDSDGDGIIDKDDQCPNEAGPEEMNGCPDRDGDGIPDKDDDCPDKKGLQEFKGCPDSDGDGIADKDDDCPNQRGLKALNGCPDRDGDGIADKDDNCPDKAGIKALKGCPKMEEKKKKEIEKKLRYEAKKILFDTGKATIKPQSFPVIDKIIGILNQYPKVKFSVEGHTDNTGNAENNKRLSQDRAAAVKDYIVSKGVSKFRLDAVGYGPDRPIDTNKTRKGRANNRRVEFIIVQ